MDEIIVFKNRSKRRIELDRLAMLLGIISICALLILRDILYITINKYLFVAIVLLLCLLIKGDDLLGLTMFLIPLSIGLPGNYIFIAILVTLIFRGLLRITSTTAIIIGYFCIHETVASAVASSFDGLEIVSYLVSFSIAILLIYSSNIRENGQRKMIKYFVLGITFALFMIFIIAVNEHSLLGILSGQFRIGRSDFALNTMVMQTNANTVGMLAVLNISIILATMQKKLFRFSIAIIMLCACILIGFCSMSRTFVITLVLTIFLFLLTNMKLKLRKILIVSCSCILLFALYSYLLKETRLLTEIIDRFYESDITTANGRSYIVKLYMEWLSSNNIHLLFGGGALYNHIVSGIIYTVHTGIIQVFVSYGLVGGVIFVAVFILAVIKAKNKKKIGLIPFIPLIIMIVFDQSLQLFNPIIYFLLFTGTFCVIRLYSLPKDYISTGCEKIDKQNI